MKTIKIKEEMRLPGTDVILEAGDKIRVMKEKRLDSIFVRVNAGNDTYDIFGSFRQGEVTSVTNGFGEEVLRDVSPGGQYGRLLDYISAVNILLSPKVEDISID